MGRACRDCSRCTEPGLTSMVMTPLRLISWALTFWNLRLLQRRCPECRHRMGLHSKVGGRFVD